MGNSRRHWLPAALLVLLSVGVLGQRNTALGRIVQRRKSLKQTPQRGLGRYLSTMLKESLHYDSSKTSALLPVDLMEEYFGTMDDKTENSSLFVSVSTHNSNHQGGHPARGLRLRPKRKWSDAGKGGKGGNLSKASKGNKISHYGKGASKSWKNSLGPSKGSKHDTKIKSHGKGHVIGPWYKPTKKSTSSKSKNGKGGSKTSKASTKKRTAIKDLDNICSGLDFRYGGSSIQGSGSWVQGKGKRRELERTERSLQFGGELCKQNVLDVARSNPNLSIFVELIEAAELEYIFFCAGPFTLLVPSNGALNMNPTLLKTLFNPQNMAALQETLLYHILPGFYESDSFRVGPLRTLLGADVDVSLDPLKFNQAAATETDILACNGAINVIDDLLIPPGSPVLPEICQALDFRTEDQTPALIRMRTAFLEHFSRQVEDETKIFPVGGNGHRALQFEGARCQPSITDVAANNPLLSTFVELLIAAGLEDIFLCAGPFTVLAPTNESFENLDPELLEMLMRPKNKELLQEILLYHILPGYIPSDELQEGPNETLLFGFNVSVALDPIRFNEDTVIVRPDTAACNGILQIIDDVLLPSEPDFCDAFTFEALMGNGQNSATNILDVARADPDLSVVVGLIENAGLENIFDCPGPFTALLPTNAAFEALDPEYLAFLQDPANLDELEDLLLYHILPGATQSSDFQAGTVDTLLLGETVDVGISPLTFDESNLITPDIFADNGLIDKIDTVLTPFPVPDIPQTASPSEAPTICDEYTFERRLRLLQNGGDDCANNVYETALNDPSLQVITGLIEQAGLAPIFDCAGPFTALLPTNTAFDAVDPKFLEDLFLPENMELFRNILLYHILPGAVPTSEFPAGPADTLFTGNQVDVGLDPTRFDNANVVTPDIVACNGYIDVIDGVLNPFPNPFCAEYTFDRRVRRLQDEGEDCNNNLFFAARLNPDLEVITSLIELAGLDLIFSCAGPFTALLPTNAAFADLDPELLDELKLPENLETLQNLLLYHILPGATRTTEFTAGPTDTLFTGNQVEVGLNPIQFDTSNLVTPDIVACNGYINVVDTVLDPFAGPPTTAPSAAPTEAPTPSPTTRPTSTPTAIPSPNPTATPTAIPSPSPTSTPTAIPSPNPTATPTAIPSPNPTATPTAIPSPNPTASPTALPSPSPTVTPSGRPTAAPSGAPTDGPTGAPSSAPVPEFIEVRLGKYFMSYVTSVTEEPTQAAYDQLVLANEQWFGEVFADHFANTADLEFVDLQLLPGETKHNAGIPEPKFNIYMDYDDGILRFTGTSKNIPAPFDLFVIYTNGITEPYLLDVVRALEGTPFADVTEGYTARPAQP